MFECFAIRWHFVIAKNVGRLVSVELKINRQQSSRPDVCTPKWSVTHVRHSILVRESKLATRTHSVIWRFFWFCFFESSAYGNIVIVIEVLCVSYAFLFKTIPCRKIVRWCPKLVVLIFLKITQSNFESIGNGTKRNKS